MKDSLINIKRSVEARIRDSWAIRLDLIEQIGRTKDAEFQTYLRGNLLCVVNEQNNLYTLLEEINFEISRWE